MRQERGSHCLQDFTLFPLGAGGVTQMQVNNTDTECFYVVILNERVSFSIWRLFHMFMFGAFTLIMAPVVECFLPINTGRGCSACETSVMQ